MRTRTLLVCLAAWGVGVSCLTQHGEHVFQNIFNAVLAPAGFPEDLARYYAEAAERKAPVGRGAHGQTYIAHDCEVAYGACSQELFSVNQSAIVSLAMFKCDNSTCGCLQRQALTCFDKCAGDYQCEYDCGMAATAPLGIQLAELRFYDEADGLITQAPSNVNNTNGTRPHFPERVPENAFDMDPMTVWLDEKRRTLEVAFDPPIQARSFDIITAQDHVDSDPVRWRLYGFAKGSTDAVLLSYNTPGITPYANLSLDRGATLPAVPFSLCRNTYDLQNGIGACKNAIDAQGFTCDDFKPSGRYAHYCDALCNPSWCTDTYPAEGFERFRFVPYAARKGGTCHRDQVDIENWWDPKQEEPRKQCGVPYMPEGDVYCYNSKRGREQCEPGRGDCVATLPESTYNLTTGVTEDTLKLQTCGMIEQCDDSMKCTLAAFSNYLNNYDTSLDTRIACSGMFKCMKKTQEARSKTCDAHVTKDMDGKTCDQGPICQAIEESVQAIPEGADVCSLQYGDVTAAGGRGAPASSYAPGIQEYCAQSICDLAGMGKPGKCGGRYRDQMDCCVEDASGALWSVYNYTVLRDSNNAPRLEHTELTCAQIEMLLPFQGACTQVFGPEYYIDQIFGPKCNAYATSGFYGVRGQLFKQCMEGGDIWYDKTGAKCNTTRVCDPSTAFIGRCNAAPTQFQKCASPLITGAAEGGGVPQLMNMTVGAGGACECPAGATCEEGGFCVASDPVSTFAPPPPPPPVDTQAPPTPEPSMLPTLAPRDEKVRFTAVPACPDPDKDMVTVYFSESNGATVGNLDRVMIVPEGTPCTLDCADAPVCDSVELFEYGGVTSSKWERKAGDLGDLAPQTPYTLCYFLSNIGVWVRAEDDFSTCGTTRTPEPPTPSPEPATPGPIPTTMWPMTMWPMSGAPATPSPKPATPGPIPTTMWPMTMWPMSGAPPTQAPDLPPSPSPVPAVPTPEPSTPNPEPATPAPFVPTPTPSDTPGPVPSTMFPMSGAPPTRAPDVATPAPDTPVPGPTEPLPPDARVTFAADPSCPDPRNPGQSPTLYFSEMGGLKFTTGDRLYFVPGDAASCDAFTCGTALHCVEVEKMEYSSVETAVFKAGRDGLAPLARNDEYRMCYTFRELRGSTLLVEGVLNTCESEIIPTPAPTRDTPAPRVNTPAPAVPATPQPVATPAPTTVPLPNGASVDFVLSPSCPDPEGTAEVVAYVVPSGGAEPETGDRVMVVPAGARSCAQYSCATAALCGEVDVVVQSGIASAQWRPGAQLARLRPQEEYGLCYYFTRYGGWVLGKDPLRTCGIPTTDTATLTVPTITQTQTRTTATATAAPTVTETKTADGGNTTDTDAGGAAGGGDDDDDDGISAFVIILIVVVVVALLAFVCVRRARQSRAGQKVSGKGLSLYEQQHMELMENIDDPYGGTPLEDVKDPDEKPKAAGAAYTPAKVEKKKEKAESRSSTPQPASTPPKSRRVSKPNTNNQQSNSAPPSDDEIAD